MENLNITLSEIDDSMVKVFTLVISYQSLKKSLSTISNNIILYFYNTILFSAKISNKLYVSIIKPLLKDSNKQSNEIRNI